MKTSKLIAVAVLAASVLGFSNSAQAEVVYSRIDCGPTGTTDLTAKVTNTGGTSTAASACQYISPADPSNTGSIAHIAAAGFFGFFDWTVNGTNGQVDPIVDSAGTWAIQGVNFDAFDYIIVFKDGAGTNLVAFLLNEDFSFGDWSSPFTDPPFTLPGGSEVHGVSHYTIAQHVTGEPPCEVNCGPRRVPEPNSLALMSLGLLGAAFVVKRRRSHRRA